MTAVTEYKDGDLEIVCVVDNDQEAIEFIKEWERFYDGSLAIISYNKWIDNNKGGGNERYS